VKRVAITAAASSANLGPGFDCIAMALHLRNELLLKPGSGRVIVEGEGAGDLPTDRTNLIARCFEQVAPGLLDLYDLHCTNRIPPARGLGSSTAAAALGFVAGWTVTERPWTPADLFARLVEVDGHGDNAAAVAYGSIAVAAPALVAAGQEPLRISPPGWLAPIVVVPERHLETRRARNALRSHFERADTVTALGNASGLTAALASGDRDALRTLIASDLIHEPPRAELVPELEFVRAHIARTEALGATISGAGPSVLVWSDHTSRDDIASVLREKLPQHSILTPALDLQGVVAVDS
jgi:homoserine kinase